jgi:membrane protein CcdC involved in cytochrome C biogenesis
MSKFFYLISLLLFSLTAFAVPKISFGEVADNITQPIEVVTGFVSVGCLIIGMSCLFAALVKYFEHRRNPLYVPFSKVVWLLIIGLLLLILPFAYILTGNTASFDFLWGG